MSGPGTLVRRPGGGSRRASNPPKGQGCGDNPGPRTTGGWGRDEGGGGGDGEGGGEFGLGGPAQSVSGGGVFETPATNGEGTAGRATGPNRPRGAKRAWAVRDTS